MKNPMSKPLWLLGVVMAMIAVLAYSRFRAGRGPRPATTADRAPAVAVEPDRRTDPGPATPAPRPRAPRTPSLRQQTEGGATSAMGEPVPEDMLGEVIADATACEKECGGKCLKDGTGRLRCPRICKSDDECDSESICVSLGRMSRCLRSECSATGADDECGPGKTCLYSGRMEGGIYRCQATGTRRVGDYCAMGSATKAEERCGPAQACANGLCMPATCQANADCPKGAICARLAGGAEHKQCVPFCASDADCPSNLSCIQLSNGSALCSQYTHAECLRSGCPAGQRCTVHRAAAWDLQASCVASCSPQDPGSCPAGEHCALDWGPGGSTGSCVRTCQVGPSACPAAQVCAQDRSGAFGCRPRWAALPKGS
jgi:hypothetical protein